MNKFRYKFYISFIGRGGGGGGLWSYQRGGGGFSPTEEGGALVGGGGFCRQTRGGAFVGGGGGGGLRRPTLVKYGKGCKIWQVNFPYITPPCILCGE